MHELSLVENLFAQLEQLVEEHHANRVLTVTVKIGPFAGIVLDSFTFAFTVLRSDERYIRWAEKAEVKYITPKPHYLCECGFMQERDRLEPGLCDKCSSNFLLPAAGENDIVLQQVEME